MAENFQNLSENNNLRIQEAQQIPSKVNGKSHTKIHHSKKAESKHKEKIWKQQEKKDA